MLSSEFLRYLVAEGADDSEQERVPPLKDLSRDIGLNVAKLREQVEVAKAFGFVDVRPRVGIRKKPYQFTQAVQESLLYAVALDRKNFDAFAELRIRVESAFWGDAVCRLTQEDQAELQALMRRAWVKLSSRRIQIPHTEHRQLHTRIFSRFDNPFVQGVIQAYWRAYEAVELDTYADITYLQEVWDYHQRMVDAICAGEIEQSRTIFEEHTRLLRVRHEPGR